VPMDAIWSRDLTCETDGIEASGTDGTRSQRSRWFSKCQVLNENECGKVLSSKTKFDERWDDLLFWCSGNLVSGG
jgi:hypothetical protein